MRNQEQVSRRHFLRCSTHGLAGLSAAGLLSSCSSPMSQDVSAKPQIPTRILGRTGLRVSILGYGGGSQFALNEDGQWEPHMERAVEMGINLFDTAPGYQWKSSLSCEERFGKILSNHRKQVYLSTKIDSRDVPTAMKEFERSLKRMNTDYLDILMLHGVGPDEDPVTLEKGIYGEARRLQEQGVVRFIGFSAMNDGKVAKHLIETLDPDVVLLTLSATRYTQMAKLAIPAAQKRNTGVMAMKVMRNVVVKHATASELLQYTWALPGVSTALIGHIGMEPLEENYRLAQEFDRTGNISQVSAQQLETRLAPLAGPHALCWARPDYSDGMLPRSALA